LVGGGGGGGLLGGGGGVGGGGGGWGGGGGGVLGGGVAKEVFAIQGRGKKEKGKKASHRREIRLHPRSFVSPEGERILRSSKKEGVSVKGKRRCEAAREEFSSDGGRGEKGRLPNETMPAREEGKLHFLRPGRKGGEETL